MNRNACPFLPFSTILLTVAVARAQPAPTPHVSPIDGAEMALIPSGPFIYGAVQGETKTLVKELKTRWADIYKSEHDRKTLNRPSFYIDRFEVTNERYGRFVRATKHPHPSRFLKNPQLNDPKQPVVGVGWPDAEAYCKWAGKRLPTEEEWEKAARGSDGRTWPWGNQPEPRRYNGRGADYGAPYPVGSFPAGNSPYQVADMAGNVWEMTASKWKDGSMVMRGGSFLNPLADVRVTVRWAAADEARGAMWLGFRCAMDADGVGSETKP